MGEVFHTINENEKLIIIVLLERIRHMWTSSLIDHKLAKNSFHW